MTQRLLGVAQSHWRDIDGYALGNGVGDLGEMPLGRVVNFVWWYCTRNADEKERRKFENQLWRPPKGVIPTTGPWAPQNETEGLMALKRSLGQ